MKKEFKPIAMRCTQKQWKSIEEKIKENGGKISRMHFNDRLLYLVNNYKGIYCTFGNVSENTCVNYKRTVYETFDKKILFESCGWEWEEEKPKRKLIGYKRNPEMNITATQIGVLLNCSPLESEGMLFSNMNSSHFTKAKELNIIGEDKMLVPVYEETKEQSEKELWKEFAEEIPKTLIAEVPVRLGKTNEPAIITYGDKTFTKLNHRSSAVNYGLNGELELQIGDELLVDDDEFVIVRAVNNLSNDKPYFVEYENKNFEWVGIEAIHAFWKKPNDDNQNLKSVMDTVEQSGPSVLITPKESEPEPGKFKKGDELIFLWERNVYSKALKDLHGTKVVFDRYTNSGRAQIDCMISNNPGQARVKIESLHPIISKEKRAALPFHLFSGDKHFVAIDIGGKVSFEIVYIENDIDTFSNGELSVLDLNGRRHIVPYKAIQHFAD